MSAIKSQIEAMQGKAATINPQGETARFLLADVRGKDAAVAFRLSVIRTAVLEVLKGNPRNLKEAMELVNTLGKGKKARAYAAGFAPLMDVAALERSGKWMDSANAGLRSKADTLADAYTAQFASAHAAVMAEKAAPKAKKETPAPAPAADTSTAGSTEGDGTGDSSTDAGSVDLSIGDVVDSVVTAIKQGMLSAEELVLLRAALASVEDTVDMAAIAAMGAGNPLLRAQAH